MSKQTFSIWLLPIDSDHNYLSKIIQSLSEEHDAPFISSNQLNELSHKIIKTKPPGSINLSNNWQVKWDKNFIKIIQPINK